MWIRQLLRDLGFSPKSPTVVFEDNQRCIKTIESESMSQRTKHIDIKYNFLRHEQKNETVKFTYIPTEHNLADIFTKPLTISRFRTLRDQIMSPGRPGDEGVGFAGAATHTGVPNGECATGGEPPRGSPQTDKPGVDHRKQTAAQSSPCPDLAPRAIALWAMSHFARRGLSIKSLFNPHDHLRIVVDLSST